MATIKRLKITDVTEITVSLEKWNYMQFIMSLYQ